MAMLRFPTIRSLFEAFPTAADDIAVPAGDDDCIALLQALTAQEAWHPAVSLCAYILPRREAVWWGCQSLRAARRLEPEEDAILEAAEEWVRQPDEARRRLALDLGTRSDAGLPGTWMAFAAGWSGGSIVPPDYAPVRPPPEQTARCVRAGLMIAIAQMPQAEVPGAVGLCITRGIALAVAGTP
ncbi:DUF6931 family protein [Xanthobacter sp. AM11]|uniref:DUF6931 family protein n=1 Tax=Xanthobacter sp. AM11 TaxID=3380643 RepID=UPI0039BFB894